MNRGSFDNLITEVIFSRTRSQLRHNPRLAVKGTISFLFKALSCDTSLLQPIAVHMHLQSTVCSYIPYSNLYLRFRAFLLFISWFAIFMHALRNPLAPLSSLSLLTTNYPIHDPCLGYAYSDFPRSDRSPPNMRLCISAPH